MSKTAATSPVAARAREFFKMQEQAQMCTEAAAAEGANIESVTKDAADAAVNGVKDELGDVVEEAFKSDAFKDSVDGVVTKALEEYFKDDDDDEPDGADDEADDEADAAADAAELVEIKGVVIEALHATMPALLEKAVANAAAKVVLQLLNSPTFALKLKTIVVDAVREERGA